MDVSLCDTNVDKIWINLQNRKDLAVEAGKQRTQGLSRSAANQQRARQRKKTKQKKKTLVR